MNRRKRKTSMLTLMFLIVFLFSSIQPTPVIAAETVHTWVTSETNTQPVYSLFNAAILEGRGFLDWLTGTFNEVTKTDEEKKGEALEKSVLPEKQPAPSKKVANPKKVKELVGKRTESTKFYELSDGRVQAEIASGPIHYKDSKGKYQEINTTIESTAVDGFSYKNEKNPFKTFFGKKSDKLFKISLDKHHLQIGVNGKATSVSPTIKGNTLTYAGLFPDASVKYTLTSRGVKEEIILEKAPLDPTYSFTFQMNGVEAKAQKDGSINFTDKQDGRVVLTIPAPMMMDSKTDPSSPYGKVWSSKVSQTVEQKGAHITVTLKADPVWLKDTNRQYPVTIDPTVIVQPNPGQSQDAFIFNGVDERSNFNQSNRLPVGTTGSQIARSLVKFDLSSIEKGTHLDMARVEMYYDQSFYTNSNNVNIDLHMVTKDWKADSVTWLEAQSGEAWNTPGGGGDFNKYKDYTEEIVDNTDRGKTSMVGSWPYSTNVSGYYGSNYQPNAPGSGVDSFTWIPTVPEDGTYRVDTRYTSATDRATDAPYTVNYNGGNTVKRINQQINGGSWNVLGDFNMKAGTTHSVVLKDDANGFVIADAIRLLKFATDTKVAKNNNQWHHFSMRRLAQAWVNGTAPNYGVLLKASTESLGQGGPRYIPSLNYDEDSVRPKLVLIYGEPSVTVKDPTKMYGTGAELNWNKYTGSEFAEYQIHRSIYQNFTPNESTLVAPVTNVNQLTFTDTTATPKPADESGLDGNAYYYQVAVKKTNGQVLHSNTVLTRLPKAGVVKQIVQQSTPDAHITSVEPTVNKGSLTTMRVGTESSDGRTITDTNRGLVKFDLAGIPADTNVIYSSLQLWGWQTYNNGGTIDVFGLNQAFNETSVTWNQASSGVNWTTAGGSYSTPATGSLSGFINDPKWYIWNVTSLMKSWVNGSKTNHGFFLKKSDETTFSKVGYVDFLSQQAQEPKLHPKLYLYYTDTQTEGTFHSPDTPEEMDADHTQNLDVTITNTTQTTWTGNDFVLSYDWEHPDGTAVTDVAAAVDTALKMVKSDGTVESTVRNVAPGETITVRAQVNTPKATDYGSERRAYTLNWKMKNKSTGSQTGIPPEMPQHVAVKKAKSNQIGMEKFYQYTGKNTGAGSTSMVNLANGNTIFSYDPFTNPSRGLATFLRMTYNSMDTSDSVLGYGWSLSASSIMRLGTPLDIHPKTLLNDNDNTQSGVITLTDGDGTTHKFTYDRATGVFEAPPGVNLYLQLHQAQSNPKDKVVRKWVMTKPDRTQFFFDDEGFLSAIKDKNGNELLFTYEERKSNNKPTKFLRYITDEVGRKTLTLDYYTKADTNNPKIIDQVKQITDISGRKLTFTYSDKGLLTSLIDGAGMGTSVEKKFDFVYDSTQGNKNTKMVSVKDPRGNTTSFTYYEAPEDPKNKWKVQSIKDRLNGETKFTYAPNATNSSYTDATVTDGLNHSTKYVLDTLGKPLEITNAKNETSKLTWDADYNVTRLEEDNGAATTWTYDNNGLPLTITDAENNAKAEASRKSTKLEYQYNLLDATGKYHVADLIKKTSPEGRVYTFTYDMVGNLLTVTDPKGNATATAGDYTTTYTYHGTTGLLKTATDANGRVTTYGDATQVDYGYDANGYPKVIKDALGKDTQTTYGVRGEVLEVTDAKGKKSTYTYDGFGRPTGSKVPKDQAAGKYIETPAPVYDQNDNVTQETASNGAVVTSIYDAADQVITTNAPKDTATSSERKMTLEYDIVGNLKKQTEPKGNLTTTDPNDFVTTYTYDAVNQVLSVTNSQGHKISYEYDNVGNQVKVTEPKGNKTTTDPNDYVTTTTYDKNHRPIKVTDAAGKSTQTTYDNDSNTITVTDKEGNTTTTTYDERGQVVEVKAPHKKDASGNIVYHTTKFEYDEVGNQIKVITPRGVETATAGDFTHEKVYDELNRVKEVIYPRDPSSINPRYSATNKMIYTYDEVGNVTKVSAPPSEGQAKRNDTITTYFDNGWVKSSKDLWGINTVYDYNAIGKQISRTISGAGGTTPRTMTWDYFPDGKLKARSDTGSPAGSQAVVVDNVELQDITTVGTWTPTTSGSGFEGENHQTNGANTTATDSFTWKINVPEAGAYNVYVKYVSGSDRITDAEYTITHKDGTATVTKNQQQNGGTWVLLGKYNFEQAGSVKLSDKTANTGTGLVVSADAIKVEKDLTGIPDNESKDFQYNYDVNGNMTSMTDHSPHAKVKTYAMTYTELNQVSKVEEKDASDVAKRTINFTYDENGNSTKREYNEGYEEFEYDIRNLLTKVTHKKSAADTQPKVTSYQYTANGQTSQETLPNSNVTTYTYNLDGSLREQITKKSNGTIVNKHTLDYNANGHRTKDTLFLIDAKGTSINSVSTYEYDPMDRITKHTKTGSNARTETYTHDANNNVISQTLDGTTTTYNYDRNRLVSANIGGSTAKYNYDVYGRLRSVTSAGTLVEQTIYDGFDHVKEHKALKDGSTTEYNQTQYAYDPMDRTTQKISKAGTANAKTTDFAYLGLSKEVLMELEGAKVVKSYQYSPAGKRLAMMNHKDTGDETSYYGYNTRTDVEMLYKPDGSVEGTYGYTAYGKEDKEATTGVDDPDATGYDPEKPHNVYRYSAKRWDPASQSYDMGFRDYSPGLNRFTSLDMYNGALADLNLSMDPWNSNRYAFTGGNPISRVDLDGHFVPIVIAGVALTATQTAVLATGIAAAAWSATPAGQETISDGLEEVGNWLSDTWDKTTSFFSSLAGSTSATAEAEATRDDDYVTIYRGTDQSLENRIYQETGHLLSNAAQYSYMSNSYSMEQHEALATAYKDAFEAHTKWLQIFGSESKYAIEHSKKGTELSQQYNLDRTLISVTTDKSVAQRFANGGSIYSARVPKNLFNTHFIKQPLSTSTESEYLMRLGSGPIQFTPIQ